MQSLLQPQQQQRQQRIRITSYNVCYTKLLRCIQLPDDYQNGAVLSDLTKVPVILQDNKRYAVVTLPACGSVTLYRNEEKTMEKADVIEAKAYEKDGLFYLENAWIKAELTKSGNITSFIVKESGRESYNFV